MSEGEKPERVIELAEQLLREKQAEAAVTMLQPWVEANPDSPAGWELLAVAYCQLGRWAEAEVPAGQRVRLEPDNASAWSNWGTTLRKSGRLDEARDAQAKALEIEPGYARARTELRKTERDRAGGDRAGRRHETATAVDDITSDDPPWEKWHCRRCKAEVPKDRDLCDTCMEADRVAAGSKAEADRQAAETTAVAQAGGVASGDVQNSEYVGYAVLGLLFGLFASIGGAAVALMNKDDERKRKLGWWTAAWGAGWFLACIVGWQTVLGMVLGGGTGSVVAPGVPRTAPVVTASSWEPVAFWRGSGIKNTDAFTVQSPWRIGWRTWPSETMMGMDGNFIIQVYDLANTSGPMAGLPVEVAANVIGRSEDYSTYYTSGTLRLEINASQEYELTVYQGVP